MKDTIFSPAFGNKPGTLVGREKDMRCLAEGLHVNPGNKERVRLIIGQRGLGKTVLLLELAEYARKNNYIVASPTVVSGGMLELKQLIIAYQEMVGEGQNIAMVFAGLPAAISRVLNQHVLTFFNRASKLYLEPIPIYEISIYFQKCFDELGIKIKDEWIEKAAEKTKGSPYMMQLAGHYLTVFASDEGVLTAKDFDKALSYAGREFVQDICEITLAPLSEMDIEFLKAMSEDEKESTIKDIGKRLGTDSAYVQRYKSRLLQAGVITQSKRGIVEYAVPYLKEYFRTLSE